MTTERPTLRPVTLARLIEAVYLCGASPRTSESLADTIEVTNRRSRETVLEACRLSLLRETDTGSDGQTYHSSDIGDRFLRLVQSERWAEVSRLLRSQSPHYDAYLTVLESCAPLSPDDLLERLQMSESSAPRSYNQTSIDVLSDWAERLGAVQRNAFTGRYYSAEDSPNETEFTACLVSMYDDFNQTTGLGMRQHYVSIPLLREHVCERLRWPRSAFDPALLDLFDRNIGRMDLHGTVRDTGAKEARFGIKTIDLTETDHLVTTTHTTDRVMRGVERQGKQFYYLELLDDELNPVEVAQ